MAIIGITFDNQGPTASDHGVLFGSMLRDGILRGCEINTLGAEVTVNPGWLVLAGRLAQLPTAETLTIGAASGVARVLLQADMSKPATEEVFEQLTFVIQTASSAAALPPLQQEDINAGGLYWQLPVCTLELGSSGIVSVLDAAPRAGIYQLQAELPSHGWVDERQTVTVPGIGPETALIVCPAPESFDAWADSAVRATAQGFNLLTFSCLAPAPASSLLVNILVAGG